MIERIKQEENDADDRMDELRPRLALLEKVEKRQLISEDQFRAIERLLEVLTRRLGFRLVRSVPRQSRRPGD